MSRFKKFTFNLKINPSILHEKQLLTIITTKTLPTSAKVCFNFQAIVSTSCKFLVLQTKQS